MPRAQRKKSTTGIYHALLRGINQQRLFEDEEDYLYFLDSISVAKDDDGCALLAYCLMSNHVHLLIEERNKTLERFFRRLGSRYVFWFNWKYQRSGHLFQDRFKSEPVEDDAYLVTVISYLHQNPVKAGICAHPFEYRWSSRNRLKQGSELIDERRLFELVTLDEIIAQEEIIIDTNVLEAGRGRRMLFDDKDAATLLDELCGAKTTSAFQTLPVEQQHQIAVELRRRRMPIRQVVRLTGLSKGIIERLNREHRQDR